MSTESRAYKYLMAGILFLFLLLSDWVILNGPLLAVRRGLLAALALAAVPYVLRHRREVARMASSRPLSSLPPSWSPAWCSPPSPWPQRAPPSTPWSSPE